MKISIMSSRELFISSPRGTCADVMCPPCLLVP